MARGKTTEAGKTQFRTFLREAHMYWEYYSIASWQEIDIYVDEYEVSRTG